MNNDIMYERRWRLSKLNVDKVAHTTKKYDLILKEACTKYMSSLVLEHAGDPKSLFKLIDSFLNKTMKTHLRPTIS